MSSTAVREPAVCAGAAGPPTPAGTPGRRRPHPGATAPEAAITILTSSAAADTGAAGDFETFTAARWTRLVRTAYLLTGGDHHEAEDLVQTTLSKAYGSWERIRRLDSPDLYIRRALVNNNLSRHRRRRVVQLLTPRLPDRASREVAADRVEQRSALLGALASLPPRQRAVVVLRYWEDLGEQATAQVLGCSVGTVKSQASRALAKLRDHPELADYASAADR